MACNSNCLINCDEIISDQCVQYTGSDVPALGICQGDTLSTVERVVLEQLQSALVGTGITPDQVTLENCQWLMDLFIGQDANLSNLLQLLIDASCSLKDMIDNIDEVIDAQTGYSFNTQCLQNLPTNPTSNDILQSVINTLCILNTTVVAFPSTYVRVDDLSTLVTQQIIAYQAQASNGLIEYFQYMPVLTALPYFGSLSKFDNTGKGLESEGMKNLYLCNGLNGTPDLRGRLITGAVRNVPGGSLDAAVDPGNPGNPNTAYGDKIGENTHLLTITETPSHSHGVTDPGHNHTLIAKNTDAGGVGAITGGNNNTANDGTGITDTKTTGITLQSVGGNQPHNNIQPSFAAYWIIRML